MSAHIHRAVMSMRQVTHLGRTLPISSLIVGVDLVSGEVILLVIVS